MNKVIFMGRFTADPEMKTTQSGAVICNFTVAVDRRFKKDGQPTADFFNCVAFGKTAEFVSKWFTKGKMILVEGSMQNRSWEDDKNNKHYRTELIVDSVYFCGSKNGEASSSDANANANDVQTTPDIDDDDDGELPF